MKTDKITSVPLLDLARQNQPLMPQLRGAFNDVLSSGRFIMGPEVEAFESECAAALGIEYAISVSSGTDALLVALMALDIGNGDEVICPSYSFFATAGCVSRTGARPVLVDVEPDTFNISPQEIENAITNRTKAIMPVHLFGQCANMPAIVDIANRNGLLVIEDAAQGFGTQGQTGNAGTIGDVGCFSFFPSKNLGGFGDGGLVVTNAPSLDSRIRSLRSHGAKPKYFHHEIGGNFRMDALQCALMRVKLPNLPTYIKGRRANARRYDELFRQAELTQSEDSPHAQLKVPGLSPLHNFNQYVIQTGSQRIRDELKSFLQNHGVGAEIYYPRPLHLQECYVALGGSRGDCPVAELAAETTLAIPVFSELSARELLYVVETIRRFFHAN